MKTQFQDAEVTYPGSKPTGKMRRFRVTVTRTVDMLLDEGVIEQGCMPDDPVFGGRADSDMVAQHIAYNRICNDLQLSDIDGFANCPDSSCLLEHDMGWDTEVEEIHFQKQGKTR